MRDTGDVSSPAGATASRRVVVAPLAGVDLHTDPPPTDGVAGGAPPPRRIRLARLRLALPSPTPSAPPRVRLGPMPASRLEGDQAGLKSSKFPTSLRTFHHFTVKPITLYHTARVG